MAQRSLKWKSKFCELMSLFRPGDFTYTFKIGSQEVKVITLRNEFFDLEIDK